MGRDSVVGVMDMILGSKAVNPSASVVFRKPTAAMQSRTLLESANFASDFQRRFVLITSVALDCFVLHFFQYGRPLGSSSSGRSPSLN